MSKDIKLRILILSAVVPTEGSGGGCLAMKRHFIDRDDFEIAVSSQHKRDLGDIPFQVLRRSRVAHRIRRSRFARFFENVEHVLNWWLLPRELVGFAKGYRPDLIFSVVDDWHMGLAWQLSRKLDIPLAVDFQDLFALSQFVPVSRRPYRFTQQRSLAKYRFLNQNAEAVFHTSEGMRNWFAPDQRGEILYPIGGSSEVCDPSIFKIKEDHTVVYAGNCYGAYGRMLLALSNALEQSNSRIKLKIFSQGNDWNEEDVLRFTNSGTYCGSLPFAELRKHLAEADAFLTVMSFEEPERAFVSTSFTTKWLDYAPYGKPIFAWGPEYCTANDFALKHNAGCVINSIDASGVVAAFEIVTVSKDLWEKYSVGANAAAMSILDPRRIHGILHKRIVKLATKASD